METADSGPPGLAAKTEKRDALIRIEKQYQAKWKADRLFEVDAPTLDEIPRGSIETAAMHELHPKFFGTMAYPYLNGTMHAGHGFTASKAEFATGFARMRGKRALFPLGFHCTGMPIKACADKLAAEIELFGSNFKRYQDDNEVVNVGDKSGGETPAPSVREDVTKFKSKKSKAAGKNPKLKYQFQIMLALGIPREDICLFADADHWLQHFPPVVIQDLDDFGARIDWRRQFVTTDANPYYDSFIRWQMNRLRQMDKIQYGHRYTIYSPKDDQPCMDHDRTEGEGVSPQEYTAVKLEIKQLSPEATDLLHGVATVQGKIFLVAATLRPETVYGQTCCFVNPSIEYGVFDVSNGHYYITTKRAAWNMAFQGIYPVGDRLPRHASALQPLCSIAGSALVGTLVNAPLSVHKDGVRVLPLDTVLVSKGTGVVMSVPSDSPDDYVAVTDLAMKAKRYGIEKDWAELESIPIIETPAYGNLSAPTLVNEMKITSPRDVSRLAIAKDLLYKEGHYKGKMLVGEFAGQSVSSVKDKIRDKLIDRGDAFPYAEPDGSVVSRSGDECVVAYIGQWFLNYGSNDHDWQQQVLGYITDEMESFSAETKNQLLAAVQWLNQWACARSYGLGSKLPWDPAFLVESLSDSTIYQAYYTVAHLLHADRFGKKVGVANITPDRMIDEVWDYVFGHTDLDANVEEKSGIPRPALHAMRREFEYWYPLDMSVTGKDLVPNHIVFFLYIHVAMFPRRLWPKSVRSNGHLLLNGKKMSKSTGNFLTLKDAIERFGADATRIALADAGDAVEDANFDERVANSNILRLFNLKEWCEDVTRDEHLRTGPADHLWDKLFENEMNVLVQDAMGQYEKTNYKFAVRSAFYDLIHSRDFYREAVTAAGISMHKDLVQRYIELQALVMAPIIPHWADFVWSEVLKKSTSIQTESWPSLPEQSLALTNTLAYIRTVCSNINSINALQKKRMAKGRVGGLDSTAPKRAILFVAERRPEWQERSLEIVLETWSAQTKTFDEKELNMKIAKLGELKKVKPFVQEVRSRLLADEAMSAVVENKLWLPEVTIIKLMIPLIMKASRIDDVVVIMAEEWKAGADPEKDKYKFAAADLAVPGHPASYLETISV
ncbi:leucyl-tRNA synthetase [Melanomma pulvis-pyrius CBS 109.77]|uniref:leucine--tRNA ligase n=1 Tax=Melanomma pulvis-pyrius CBS 109.77 TaxID=1314802 RepID=A0A6A6WYG4_9PLEO|nr:leucyl-tRNA synthetase [Melanomma pulvis-pyrius CBS 109.77]